jgi:Domain of unknown function (DUF4395)
VPSVDARILRLEQGAVAVILLAGFVFQVQWLIPVAAVLPALDAALGPSGPTPAVWHAVIGPRIGPPKTWETGPAARAQALCVFAALIVATLLVLGGVDILATLLAIAVAGIAAAAATGLFTLGAEIDKRNQPRRRKRGQPD